MLPWIAFVPQAFKLVSWAAPKIAELAGKGAAKSEEHPVLANGAGWVGVAALAHQYGVDAATMSAIAKALATAASVFAKLASTM